MIQVQLSDGAVSTMQVLGYAATVASLILSVVAIVLSWLFKKEADGVNKDTTKLLVEIRSDEKAIVDGVLPELRAAGQTVRDLALSNNRFEGVKVGPTSTGVVSYAFDAPMDVALSTEHPSAPDDPAA